MLLQLIHFVNEHARIDHYAIADQTRFPGVEDPRGDEMKDEFPVIDHQRVTGVVAALETHHTVSLFREKVNNLAFSFISPLGSDNNNVCHDRILFLAASALEQGRAFEGCNGPDQLPIGCENRCILYGGTCNEKTA